MKVLKADDKYLGQGWMILVMVMATFTFLFAVDFNTISG